jgi:hypothetical protein
MNRALKMFGEAAVFRRQSEKATSTAGEIAGSMASSRKLPGIS